MDELKNDILNQILFYIQNFHKVNNMEFMHTVLCGPPGTGKTSIIKCIANKLNRHIIVIPLSKIKTQTEFSEYFFENRYNRYNTDVIGFDNKIIVFEDIDCMSEIVKKRKNVSENVSDDGNTDSLKDIKDNDIEEKLNMQNKLLNKIAKKVDDDHNTLPLYICTFDVNCNLEQYIYTMARRRWEEKTWI